MPVPTPSPSGLLLQVPGAHRSLDLMRLVADAPRWGVWWDHHAAWGLVPLAGVVVGRWVVKHSRGVQVHGSAWRHPFRAWRKARWWRRKLSATKMKAPRVLGVNRFPAGHTFTVGLKNATTVEGWQKLTGELASAFGVDKVIVHKIPLRADRATVHVLRHDPFADPRLSPLVSGTVEAWRRSDRRAHRLHLWGRRLKQSPSLAGPYDFRKGVPIGVDMMGRTVVLDLVGKNLLLGGIPGAGKTVLLRALISAAALDPTAALALFDGKEGVGFRPWKHLARWYVADSEDMLAALAALRSVKAELDRRCRVMDLHGWDVWPCHKQGPGKGGPILIVIDEYAAFSVDCTTPLPGGAKPGPVFSALTQAIVRKGRAAAMPVVLATQRPSVDIVPGSLRDLFGWCYALLCSRAAGSDTILGQGSAALGFDASNLPGNRPGLGWLKAESGSPELVRAFDLPRSNAEDLARQATELRAAAGALPISEPGSRVDGNGSRPGPLLTANGHFGGSNGAGLAGDPKEGKEGSKNGRGIQGEMGGHGGEEPRLEPREADILALLADAPRTIPEIMSALDLTRYATDEVLKRLRALGLLADPTRRIPGGEKPRGNMHPLEYQPSPRGLALAKKGAPV